MKKKSSKPLLVLGSVGIVGLILFIFFNIYFYYNPEIEIHICTISRENSNIDVLHLSYNERSIFGISDQSERAIQECGAEFVKLYERVEIELSEPRVLTINAVQSHGKIVFVYEGYGMDGDEKELIEGKIVLEYPAKIIIES